jgi:hypothetical protein
MDGHSSPATGDRFYGKVTSFSLARESRNDVLIFEVSSNILYFIESKLFLF